LTFSSKVRLRARARLISGAFALASMVAVFAVPGAAAAATPTTSATNTSTFAAQVVQLTNAQRTQAGLKPLTANTALTTAAQQYAGVLSSDACFAHTCPPVADLATRLKNAGYSFSGYTSWTYGENIAAGYQTPSAVVAGWMASPGHRANILNANFKDIGVGLVYKAGTRYGYYWVEDFGARNR
jgi:uncharacterized protein YkwD